MGGSVRLRRNTVRLVSDHCPACVGLLSGIDRKPCPPSPECAISLGEIADIVRSYLPDARINFEKDNGGREASGNHMIDNTRLVSEFGLQYRPYRERVLQIINDIRRDKGLPPVG